MDGSKTSAVSRLEMLDANLRRIIVEKLLRSFLVEKVTLKARKYQIKVIKMFQSSLSRRLNRVFFLFNAQEEDCFFYETQEKKQQILQ